MKPWLILAALAASFFASPVSAQTPVSCQVAPGTVSASGSVQLQCDSAGNLKTTGGGGTAAVPATGTGGFTAVTVGTTSAQAAAAATRTERLSVKNESATASIAICLGTCTAALNSAGSITIAPGQLLTLSNDAYVPGDAVAAIASATSTPVTVWSK